MPDYRERKLGKKKLLIELAKVADENDCGRMEWHIYNWNKPALKFYLKIGGELKIEFSKIYLAKSVYQELANLKV